jgi:hypothetical protein
MKAEMDIKVRLSRLQEEVALAQEKQKRISTAIESRKQAIIRLGSLLSSRQDATSPLSNGRQRDI